MILGIHHVQITCPAGEEDAARRFYCGILGFEEIAKPVALRGRGGIWLSVGSLELHIGTESGVDRQASKAHVAYLVRNLATWRARLAAQRLDVADGIPSPGYQRIEFRDPFGNRVELVEAIP